jgi:hypothetical protein
MLREKIFLHYTNKKKKLKNGEHFGRHSRDEAIIAWHNTQEVIRVSMYCTDEM